MILASVVSSLYPVQSSRTSLTPKATAIRTKAKSNIEYQRLLILRDLDDAKHELGRSELITSDIQSFGKTKHAAMTFLLMQRMTMNAVFLRSLVKQLILTACGTVRSKQTRKNRSPIVLGICESISISLQN